jgi:hypothetical protein
MGTLIDVLQSFQFDTLQLFIACLLLFTIGHLSGKRKVKKLNEEISKLHKDVMELNSELLFGGQETKVINFKKSPEKKKAMAN